jgi:hypothetical protein
VVTPEGQIMTIYYDTHLSLRWYHLDVTCKSTLLLLKDPLTSDNKIQSLSRGPLKDDSRMIPTYGKCLNTDQNVSRSSWEKNPSPK